MIRSQGRPPDDPEIKKLLIDTNRGMRRGVPLIRYWGSQELENLSPESMAIMGFRKEAIEDLKSKLLAQGVDESSLVDEMDTSILRLTFANTYFGNKGWDISQPTSAQLHILRQQPVFNDPLGAVRDR